MTFEELLDRAVDEAEQHNYVIRNEFGEYRDEDEILKSGYITLMEYLGKLRLGSQRDDLSWDYLDKDRDTKDFLKQYGFEGEFSYGVNMTPSRFVFPIVEFMAGRIPILDSSALVIEIENSNVFLTDKETWKVLTRRNKRGID